MTEQTIVAVYDTAAHAEDAVRDLMAANVRPDAISQHAKSGAGSSGRKPVEEQGFWASIFGAEPDHDTAIYDRSIESGASVVTVRAAPDQMDRISAILEKHNPVDLDERAAEYGAIETTTTRTAGARPQGASATPGEKLQLKEESLSVGKRAVSGGTTRVRRYVVETPVEEQVTLHTEKVTLERQPVTDGRIVGAADFADKTIEMTETSEQAVVSKTARVTEEVSLRKEASDHVETVKDTVRRDEVEIERVPESKANTDGLKEPLAKPRNTKI